LVKNDQVLVIECNLRASRSMPFVSKTIGRNLMDLAADAIMGEKVEDGEGTPKSFAVKAPQFSFTRLENADPVTGVEMVSTGEVACFGETFQEAFMKALVASNFYLPVRGDAVLITMGETRRDILPYARMLFRSGYKIFATQHTAEEFQANGIDCSILHKVRERTKPNILDYLTSKEIKLVINIPAHHGDLSAPSILRDEYLIRRKAAEFGIPVVTNLELARALVKSLVKYDERTQQQLTAYPMSAPAPIASEEGTHGSKRKDSTPEEVPVTIPSSP
jgi:carbamoyl-phosphate synthase large subunit